MAMGAAETVAMGVKATGCTAAAGTTAIGCTGIGTSVCTRGATGAGWQQQQQDRQQTACGGQRPKTIVAMSVRGPDRQVAQGAEAVFPPEHGPQSSPPKPLAPRANTAIKTQTRIPKAIGRAVIFRSLSLQFRGEREAMAAGCDSPSVGRHPTPLPRGS